MTRYQVWKARERTRFRADSEHYRLLRKYGEWYLAVCDEDEYDRVTNAVLSANLAQIEAYRHNITGPFLG